MKNDKTIKALGGVGPGESRGAYAEAFDRAIRLANENHKANKAVEYMEAHEFEWRDGKWVKTGYNLG